MQPHPPLETIAQRLAEQLRCEQEDLCLPILQQVSRGKFLTKAELGAELQLDQDELERRLMQLPDTEFDQQGNILGWGVTLVPTSHRFQIRGTPLFTWCAFDTVLFPLSLGAPAHVQSTCPVTGHPIKFMVTPEGDFYICYKNPDSQYHRFLGLSYPTLEDAERGLRDKLISREEFEQIRAAIAEKKCPPWKTALGGEVGLHGPCPNQTWTHGCVAMSVEHIERLYELLELSDEVTILP